MAKSSIHRSWGYTYLVTEQDRLWYDEGLRRRWRLNNPASRPWRLWGIRHARAFWTAGLWWVLSVATTDYEEWRHYAVRRGWA